MNRLLLPVMLAGGAAAQITALPKLNVRAVAARQNDEWDICTSADDIISSCVDSLGGGDALATADPVELIGCACCNGRTPVSEIYYTCATYLFDEEPLFSSEASVYGDMYTACLDTEDFCSGSASGFASGTATTTEAESDGPSATGESDSTSGYELTDVPTITSAPGASESMPAECESMVGLFQSCVDEIDGFSELPYREQAPCYCCRTSRGSVVWTDEVDQYAQTCRNWASTGDPETYFPVASTFAGFCENFSDVCEGAVPTNTESDAEITNAASPTEPEGRVTTVTVEVEPDAAAGLLPSAYAAGVIAFAVAALMY